MEESEFVSQTIRQWAEAHQAAQRNPGVMIESNFSQPVMEECAARMKKLEYAEDEMLSLNRAIPQALQNHMDARADRACSSCWFSSRGPKHPECRSKIDRFFRTRTELYNYARKECDPAQNLTDLKDM